MPFEVTLAEIDELSYAYVGFARVSGVPDFVKLEKDRYEYVLPMYRKFVLITSLPNFLLRFIKWVLNKFTREQRLAKRLDSLKKFDHDGVSDLYLRFNQWREMFDAKWRAAGIDALISPCSFHSAFKIEHANDLATIHDYYYMFNFIHYPAGVIPVTQVLPEEARGTYISDTNNRWNDSIA